MGWCGVCLLYDGSYLKISSCCSAAWSSASSCGVSDGCCPWSESLESRLGKKTGKWIKPSRTCLCGELQPWWWQEWRLSPTVGLSPELGLGRSEALGTGDWWQGVLRATACSWSGSRLGFSGIWQMGELPSQPLFRLCLRNGSVRGPINVALVFTWVFIIGVAELLVDEVLEDVAIGRF